MKDAAKFWDGISEKYAKSPIEDMEGYTRSLERTRSYLSSTDTVLELGCGTGSTALLLAENVKQIIASDLSPKMIEIGKVKAQEQGVSNIDFVVADVLESGLQDRQYDAVLALNLLHLLHDLPAGIDRIHGLLKPGGVFISKTICEFGADIPLKYRIIKRLLPLMQMIGKAPYVNFMNTRDLEDMISSGGFKIIETENYPTRYIVARKI